MIQELRTSGTFRKVQALGSKGFFHKNQGQEKRGSATALAHRQAVETPSFSPREQGAAACAGREVVSQRRLRSSSWELQ